MSADRWLALVLLGVLALVVGADLWAKHTAARVTRLRQQWRDRGESHVWLLLGVALVAVGLFLIAS